MEKLISQFLNYSLWQVGKEMIPEVARFVVHTNYIHYQGTLPSSIEHEIADICKEEIEYFPESYIFVIKDNSTHKIIASIRIFRWDKQTELATEKEFNVDVEKFLHEKAVGVEHIFHIGRLAIAVKERGKASVVLIKTLFANAFKIACSEKNAIVFVELDEKLFDKVKLLDVHVSQIGEPKTAMGSKTIPGYIYSNGFLTFLEKHKHLCYV